jgi:hypothetical protein
MVADPLERPGLGKATRVSEARSCRDSILILTFRCSTFEVPRGEKMLYSGTDPESYITDHTLVYQAKN